MLWWTVGASIKMVKATGFLNSITALGALLFTMINLCGTGAQAEPFDFPIESLFQDSSRKFPPVLMYHDVVARFYHQPELCREAQRASDRLDEDRFCQPSSDVTFAQFMAQMEYLRDKNYQTLTMAEYFEIRTGKKSIPSHAVVITFDDGYSGNYNLAYPLLKAMGFKATFFVHTDYVGALKNHPPELADPGAIHQKLNTDKNHVSWHQLREFEQFMGPEQKPLFRVYAHTKTHPRLSEISDIDLKEELNGSKQALERELGGERAFLAYPYGDYTPAKAPFDARVIRAAHAAGYLMAFTIEPTEGTPDAIKQGLFTIPRISMTLSPETDSVKLAEQFARQL